MDIPKNQRHPSREPDRSGHTAGYDWVAWEVEENLSSRTYTHLIVLDDGKLVEDTYTKYRHGRLRVHTRQHHHLGERHPSVRTYLLRKRIKQVQDLSALEVPVSQFVRIEKPRAGDVDEMLRDQQRKERKKRERKRAAEYYGKPTELVRSHEMQSYRQRGQRLANQSFAHR